MESSSAYSSVPLEGSGSSDGDDAPSVIDRYATEDFELAFTDDRLIIERTPSRASLLASARSSSCASFRG